MKISLLALLLLLLGSCGEEIINNDEILANTSCSLIVEGMMCEKGCKATIQQKLSTTNGVVTCAVDFEEKTVVIDFDNNVVSSKELIKVVDEIANGIYKASLLEESVFIQEAGQGITGNSTNIDAISVSDYSFKFPDFSGIFSNLI
ncbi:MAG: heavy-metal-associated domain-containing protein [Flavobacteriales bacterium]|nr:heavy-metal-associated domain-containing protein [Flavobacteriales bacterium]